MYLRGMKTIAKNMTRTATIQTQPLGVGFFAAQLPPPPLLGVELCRSRVPRLSREDTHLLVEFQEALQNLKLVKNGKLKATPIQELLDAI